jgi:hypothetical protein
LADPGIFSASRTSTVWIEIKNLEDDHAFLRIENARLQRENSTLRAQVARYQAQDPVEPLEINNRSAKLTPERHQEESTIKKIRTEVKEILLSYPDPLAQQSNMAAPSKIFKKLPRPPTPARLNASRRSTATPSPLKEKASRSDLFFPPSMESNLQKPRWTQ